MLPQGVAVRVDADVAVKHVARSLSFAPTPAPERVKPQKTVVLPDEVSPDTEASEIQVILRIRPLRPSERNEPICVLPFKADRKVLRIRPNVKANHQPSVKNAGYAAFRFSEVFDENCGQEQMFENTALPLVADLFRGDNAVVLAYGVTCSGKTWTIQGDDTHPGILPRALDVIVNSIAKAKGKGLMQDTQVSHDVALLTEGHFKRKRRRVKPPAHKKVHDPNYVSIDPANEYCMYASYIEVYQEKCYDLFDHRSGGVDDFNPEVKPESTLFSSTGMDAMYSASNRHVSRRPALKLKGDCNGEVYAEGQKEVQINSRADIDRLLEFGKQNRTVAHTNANEHSSRSHAIFMITLKQAKRVPCEGAPGFKTLVTTSKLQIVDLAGSERTSRTNNNASRVKEATHINTSLMTLGRCLNELRRNQIRAKQNPNAKPKPVPFRWSCLTRLLQDSLTSGRAALIVNVSPVLRDADETIQALRSASMARQLTVSTSRKRSVLTDRTNLMQSQLRGNEKPQGSTRRGEVVSKNHSHLRRSNRMLEKRLETPKTADIKGTLRHADQYILKADFIASQDSLKEAMKEMRVRLVGAEKEIRILKGELEESVLEEEAVRKEADTLFEENIKLKERLVDAETRFRTAEVILRDEIATEAEKIIKDVQEQCEQRLRDQKDRHLRELSLEERNRRRVDEVTRRLARASLAAFDGIALNFQSNQDDDRDETSEELSEYDLDSEDLEDEDFEDRSENEQS